MPFDFTESGIEFPIEQQRLSNWCWAACGVSLSTFYEGRKIMTQQGLVSRILNIPACASGRPLPACNRTLDLEVVLDRLNHLNGDPEDPLPLTALRLLFAGENLSDARWIFRELADMRY